jgi:hypothetical protein
LVLGDEISDGRALGRTAQSYLNEGCPGIPLLLYGDTMAEGRLRMSGKRGTLVTVDF